jgi:DNA-binding NtrC family response regulator
MNNPALERTALVVDDEALIRWSVSETLGGLGFAVAQAADGAAAVSAITGARAAFDVVVLDLRLPDVDDLSLLRRVRELLPAAAVILMTAFGSPEVVAGARSLGVIGILNKPFELDELSRILAPASGASLP